MSDKPSFFENLQRRRVPAIVGMYIAATWLVIELGDWVTERFGFAESLTSFVFIAMLVMLPAVALFAYNHGAPGKDEWRNSEKILIPVNAAIAIAVLYFVSPALNVEAATETVRIADETGTIQQFEVARLGFHREIVAFFWQNDTGDESLDWLSYGLPLMLTHDLNRVSPVISAKTPFHSSGMRQKLSRRGYESLNGEPQALQLDIARDRRSAALISGSYTRVGDLFSISVTLTDARTGQEIGSHAVSSSDWMTAVDDVSIAVLDYMNIKASDNQSDDPVSQHFTSSLEAVQHFTNGHLALDIDNDYPLGIASFQSALEADPTFAEASSALSRAHYLSGDVKSAEFTASQALNNSYRLSETGRFLLKANRYVFSGDYERGERVIDIWMQVKPNSADAYRAMARLGQMRGNPESLEKASTAFDKLLELDPGDVSILRSKAELEQQRGDYSAAENHLRNYLEHEPESGEAMIQLAYINQAQGDLEAAQTLLEDAAVLSDNPMQSEIGLARLEARRGLYAEAEERLQGLMHDGLDAQQRVALLSAQAEVAMVRGQIARVMQLQSETNELAKGLMPPMVRLLQIESQEANLLAQLGRTDEAIAIADAVTAQLQPPVDSYMYFTYASIYESADDRAAYREWAQKIDDAADQYPEIFLPFLETQAARLAIWDEDFDAAIDHIDKAQAQLGQSMLQVIQGNLSISSVAVSIADLYLDAGALDEAGEQLEEIRKAFPAFGFANFVSAKVFVAEGDTESARAILAEALDAWSDADADYIYRAEALALLNSL